MKLTKLIMVFSAIALLSSCSKDKKEEQEKKSTFKEVVTLSSEGHSVVVSSKNGKLVAGYNPLQVQIKDKSGKIIEVSNLNWMPMMDMGDMKHSCPKSELKKSENNIYEGFIIFQMKGKWQLSFDYMYNGVKYSVSNSEIEVVMPKRQRVSVFKGSDKKKYVLALIEPTEPKAEPNKIEVGLYTMENMKDFPVVEGYTLLIDPRMPGMGNHGSPDNIDLTQKSDGFYYGTVNFTMTGYWKINFQVENSNKQIIAGTKVPKGKEGSSSVYLEVEF